MEDLGALEPLVGQWHMVPSFVPDPSQAPNAFTTFEWLAGQRFLIQRWEVDHPDAPDGIALIGLDPAGTGYRQHYFDSRGVSRVYAMTFDDGLWTLGRAAEPPDFSQRFRGAMSPDGQSIAGTWERADDEGEAWVTDFDLTYTKVGEPPI